MTIAQHITRWMSSGVIGACLSLTAHAAQLSTEVQSFVVHDAETIVIRDVRVIDGTGVAAKPNQDVVLRGDQIVWVGATGSAPASLVGSNAVVVDGVGRSLLPGYVMMHEHLMYTANASPHFFVTNQPISFPRLYLAAGVTTARTAGGVNVSQDLNIAHEIRSGRLVGPEFDITSPHMVGGFDDEADFPYGTIGLTDLRSVAGAVRFVDYWAGFGVTSFKAHTHVSKEILQAGITAAHNKGLKFTGHLCSVTYREAAMMGIDNIEHGFFEMTDFVPGKVEGECPYTKGDYNKLTPDQPEVADLIDLLIEKNVAITSTLPVFVRGHKQLGELPESALALLDESTRIAFLRRRGRALSQPPQWHAGLDKQIRVAMSLTKAFHDRGGHLMVGTDPTGMGGTIAGIANFEAIELLVEAGLSPEQAIKVATLNGAEYLGWQDRIGSIEVGKQADLVLVRGAPDQQISDVRGVELVFKAGVGFDSKKLFQAAKGTIGAPGS